MHLRGSIFLDQPQAFPSVRSIKIEQGEVEGAKIVPGVKKSPCFCNFHFEEAVRLRNSDYLQVDEFYWLLAASSKRTRMHAYIRKNVHCRITPHRATIPSRFVDS